MLVYTIIAGVSDFEGVFQDCYFVTSSLDKAHEKIFEMLADMQAEEKYGIMQLNNGFWKKIHEFEWRHSWQEHENHSGYFVEVREVELL